MTDARAYVVDGPDAAGRMLKPLPVDSKTFQEDWLQEVLFRHPHILPVEELDDAYAPPIALGREIANIDDLFISPSGLSTIVETKLWRNAEAHRTVVAQILEYARTLAEWSYQDLDGAVQRYTAKRFGKSKSIYQIVKSEMRGLDVDELEFQQRVQDGLANGRFALVIVGDRIYPAATQLAEIIESAPHLEFSIGLVELRCVRLHDADEWPLVVMPHVVAKTKEYTRAVVKILYEEKRPNVKVETIPDADKKGSTSLVKFTALLPSHAADLFRSYLERWTKAGYIIFWGKVGFSLRIPWRGKLTTIFDAYPNVLSIIQDKRVKEHDLPEAAHEAYRIALLGSPRLSGLYAAGRRYIDYDRLSEEEVRLILDSTDTLAKACYEAGRQNT